MRALTRLRRLVRPARFRPGGPDIVELYASTPVGAALLSPRGRFLKTNRALQRLLGYDEDELEDMDFDSTTLRQDLRRCRELFERLRRGDLAHFDTEKRYVRKNGEIVWAHALVTVAPRPNGHRAIALLLDVTERKRAEERLREGLEERVGERTAELARSNSDLETYAYAASHDLSAPVRKISAYADLLQRSAGDKLDERERRMLSVVARSATRMAALIDDMLTLRRVGGLEQPLQPVDLDEVVAQALSDLELVIADARAKVDAGPLGRVLGSRNNLRRLFQNLLSNAVKFRRDGVAPVVRVDAEEDHGWVKVSVRDNGIGFEQRFADKIFRPFLRLHPVGEYSGSGVGLAICRRIAQSCGGSVEAVGRPGEGAVFTVRLRRA